jgi:hypothetical protein
MVIFISYNWDCKEVAIDLKNELILRNGIKKEVKTLMDIDNVNYNGSLSEFMTNITNADFSATLICNKFLKADNCMTELLNLFESGNFNKKILPVIIVGTEIYSTENKHKLIMHWHEKYKAHYEMVKESPININETVWKKTIFYQKISSIIGTVLSEITDRLHIQVKKPDYRENLTYEEKEAIKNEVHKYNQSKFVQLFNYLDI